MTPPEVVLWSHLRRKQLGGFRFRRQRPLGPYIADFYCHEARLVVEVDSSYHAGKNHVRDIKRDRWMNENGLRVVRVTAREIATDVDTVLSTILLRCREQVR